jgi:hypothetical protein
MPDQRSSGQSGSQQRVEASAHHIAMHQRNPFPAHNVRQHQSTAQQFNQGQGIATQPGHGYRQGRHPQFVGGCGEWSGVAGQQRPQALPIQVAQKQQQTMFRATQRSGMIDEED